MTTASATWLLARSHGRMLRHKLRFGLRENRLLSVTVAGFLGLYSLAAYLLVARGLEFMMKLPLIGPLLTERLVFLLFFFFFVMLVISNATITGMSLFRRKDMEWQIALPLPPRSLVLWKTLEGMLLASWGLLLLSTPILLALAQVYKADGKFMLVVLPALLALVMIAANVSTWLLIALVLWARRWMWKPLAAGLAVLLIQTLPFWHTSVETLNSGDLSASLNQILQHTEICMHPLLPSSWVAETIQAAGRGIFERTVFFNLVLLAHALMSILITTRFAGAFYYTAWNRVMSADPGAGRKSKTPAPRAAKPARFGQWVRRILALDRPSYALLVKEVRTFVREPVQWGQSAIIFGLLLIYSMNLRKLGYDLQSPFWITVVSHLNLLVCCLALSTLTTRFIYPQFSLEGQRMWILGLSPLPLHRVLALKLRLSASVLALIMVTLVVVSGFSLGLPGKRILFFSASILMMSYGLTSLALSLGALVPNFRESNPARIVSGFGGTVCLIASFVYIVGGMVLLLIPSWQNLRQDALTMGYSSLMELAALGGVALLTVVFGGIPYFFAKRQTKNLEYLRHL